MDKLSLRDYEPFHGDYVIWSKWFTTWYGIIQDYDKKNGILSITFEGTPYLLAMLEDSEYRQNTYDINIAKIRRAKPGTWVIIKHDIKTRTDTWYI